MRLTLIPSPPFFIIISMNLSPTLEEKEKNPEREKKKEKDKKKENNQIGNKKILDSCVRNEILHLNLYTSLPSPFSTTTTTTNK